MVVPVEFCRILRNVYGCPLGDALVIGQWFGYTDYWIEKGYEILQDEDDYPKK